ncbi:MAG: hypothetical protein M3237_02620 [Actinomycetota bacterium]|nr:hypothetical protein [Actinomycetota bacterium]
MRTRLVIAALAIPVAMLSACGEDDGDASDPGSSASSPSESASDTPTDTPTEPAKTADPSADWPACKSVWKDGARLPGGYAGCREGAEGVKADKTGCSFGRPIVTYVDRFYGVPSGIIHETPGPLEKNRGYRSAMASCLA